MPAHSIPLLNAGSLCDTHWLIHYIVRDSEWVITNIEIYADAAHTQLWADDIAFDELDARAQATVLDALNREHQHQRQIKRTKLQLLQGAA